MGHQTKRFLIINGPNLNLLGKREKSIYGDLSLDKIKERTEGLLKRNHDVPVELIWFQSNSESEIIVQIQRTLSDLEDINALIINPGAFSHTSVAILDALRAIDKPVVEVHLSNTAARESFRSIKLTAKSATIIMEGLGADAYYCAINSQLIKE